MASSLKYALERASEFVYASLKRHGNNLLGAIVFGSLAKGTWRKGSDIDIMLLFSECDYSRNVGFYGDLKFEVYSVPLRVFISPFSGDRGKLFFDMFRLQVLESGKILYDRDGFLSQLSAKLRGQRILQRYLGEVLSKSYSLINAAEKYLHGGYIEEAELSLRDASINFARALLIKMGIPEINTPRLIIPHLRGNFPELYEVFREVHGLKYMGRDEAEARITDIREVLSDVRRRFGKNAGFRGIVDKAESELLSAEDCLEVGDHDSAILQAELARSILMKNLLMRSKYWIHTPALRNMGRGDIKEYIGILREIKERFIGS